MRLTGLEFFAVAPPPPGWGGRHWQIVRLTTDDGITGLGEVYASAVGVTAMRAVIEDVFSPATWRARDPENIELMFRRAYSSGFTQRPDPDRDGRVFGAGDGVLGYPRQGAWRAGLGAAGRADERPRAGLHLPLPRAAPRPRPLLDRPENGGRGGRGARGRRLDGGEIRPRGALHDPGRAHAGAAGYRPVGRVLRGYPRGGGRCRGPALRHPWPVHPRRRDPACQGHRALRPLVVRRTGAARQFPRAGRGGPGHVDPGGDGRAADHQGGVRRGARPWRAHPATGAGPRGRDLGGQEDRDPRPRPRARRWRRISMPGRWNGRRMCIWR
jgi:hypothetical protein